MAISNREAGTGAVNTVWKRKDYCLKAFWGWWLSVPIRGDLMNVEKIQKELKDLLNRLVLPLKLVIPQPLIRKIPGLTTFREIRTEVVLKHIPEHSTIIDIRCGDNVLCHTYREDNGKCVGVDVYDWGDVDCLVQNSANLPFSKGEFDCATFVASLTHIPNRVEVLKEINRVLSDDGQVLITMLNPIPSNIWHRIAYWDKDQNERGMKEGEVHGLTESQIKKILNKSNFRVINKIHFEWGLNHLYIAESSC